MTVARATRETFIDFRYMSLKKTIPRNNKMNVDTTMIASTKAAPLCRRLDDLLVLTFISVHLERVERFHAHQLEAADTVPRIGRRVLERGHFHLRCPGHDQSVEHHVHRVERAVVPAQTGAPL